ERAREGGRLSAGGGVAGERRRERPGVEERDRLRRGRRRLRHVRELRDGPQLAQLVREVGVLSRCRVDVGGPPGPLLAREPVDEGRQLLVALRCHVEKNEWPQKRT